MTVGGSLRWLRDDLGIIENWEQVDALAAASDLAQPIYLVPPFVGIGTHWWDKGARGALFGLNRDTRRPELVRAALEAVGYQSRDMIETMRKDWGESGDIVIRVDGGMIASDWTMQFLADITGTVVDRPPVVEVTALGAAWLAGFKAGIWPDARGFAARRSIDRQFHPQMEPALRRQKVTGWRDAVGRTRPG